MSMYSLVVAYGGFGGGGEGYGASVYIRIGTWGKQRNLSPDKTLINN